MAGRIPQEFIDELLARADIVEVIDARVPLKKQGREFAACCPFHTEKTPSFTVSPHKQFYHCFGCGAHGTALGFVMDYEHLGFVEAVEVLAQDLAMEVPVERGADRPRADPGYGLLEAAAEFYRRQLKASPLTIDYLRGRGLSGQIAAEYGLGFAPAGWDRLLRHLGDRYAVEQLHEHGLVIRNEQGRYYDRFRERVMFPIRDRRGRVIAFGGRVLGQGNPKYLNSPETPLFHKGRALYGLYEARRAGADQESVIVVEGYMDVVALAQHGIRNVVATLGTATTRQHLEALYRIVPRIVFCFDGDRAGREAAWRALENLLPVFRDGHEASFLFLPEGEDPDSLVRGEGAESFRGRIGTAVPLSEFLFKYLRRGADTETTAGRARLAERARPMIDKLRDGVFKSLLYERLGELVGVPGDRLAARGAEKEVKPAPSPAPRYHSLNTPVRAAITLLLYEPGLAQVVQSLSGLDSHALAGVGLLRELIETFKENPHLTAAALVERYRDSEHHRHLLKLMEWEPPVEAGYDCRREFQDALGKLRSLTQRRRAEVLLQTERDKGLSESERAELRHLLMGGLAHE